MDELEALAAEIHAVCDEERVALRSLDVARLSTLAEAKRQLGARLSALMHGPNPPRGPEATRVVGEIRFRSEVARMLLSDAARALRALVGGQAPATYDRSAGLRATDVARLDLDA